MKFDIVFVTYNSSKWIDQCVESIVQSDYNLKNVSLIFFDNKSTDNSIELLKKWQKKYKNKFNEFIIAEGKKNYGFGIGNNEAVKLGNNEYVFIYNVDTKMHKDTLKLLEAEIKKSDDSVGMWELCQCPYEHPKYYDPYTQYVSWASGACMVVKRELFEKLGGFDKNIFMYCEDVDISWNFRRHGYNIKYLPNVKIDHYSYDESTKFKYTQFVFGFISNWYLRAKYGTFKKFGGGVVYLLKVAYREHFIPIDLDKKTKKKIKKTVKKYLFKFFFKYLLINLFKNFKKTDFKPNLKELDYEIQGTGAFKIYESSKTKPLVSIIIRTCNRPEALREALTSVRNQSYKNVEAVVVEDGKPLSKKMIEQEFSDLNINYYCTEVNKGRSNAGNIGMKIANGKYLNFLDDDDMLYPNHVETLVSYLENKKVDVAYSSSFETKVNILSRNPYKYKVESIYLYKHENFSKLDLYIRNFLPIQSVMFKKELFEETGGFDTTIDYLEDWDFWIRCSLNHEFYYVDKTTSVFRTPSDNIQSLEREKLLASTLDYLSEKFKNYHPNITVSDYYNKR